MDITENIGPRIFLALKNSNLTWTAALGELCDNAFDANATRVVVAFKTKKSLSVSDDGRGCDDVKRMLTITVGVTVLRGGFLGAV